MKFDLTTLDADKQKTDIIVVGIFENKNLSPSATAINKAAKNYLKKLMDQGEFQGKITELLPLQQLPNIQAKWVLLVGLGPQDKSNESSYQKILSGVFLWFKERGYKHLSFYLTDLLLSQRDIAWLVRQVVIMGFQGLYQFDEFKQKKLPPIALETIDIYVPAAHEIHLAEQAINEGIAISQGMKLCKDLGNLPPNVCTPSYIAKVAQELAKKYKKLTAKIYDEKAIKKMGMNAFMAVAKGSDEPPKLIVLDYKGGQKNQKPIALIGKGITFDTGGISLKPALCMDEMKYDMCGAASILGTLKAIVELNLPLNVVAVIASTENMPSGKASKPGDIVKTYSGQTVEILNTDAEGRLVLCDALSYVVDKFHPKAIIDVATLTGSMVIALGYVTTGMFSNNESLAKELEHAANQSYDRLWRLPLFEDYQQNLDTNFADMANIGPDRAAGPINAACFLSRFVGGTPWGHLDIAGTAWISGKEKGATGRPVPLLTQFLINQVRNSI